MSTLIELGYPYREIFEKGYLNINKEPRRVLSLIGWDTNRTSTSYARYLMACHLGRFLEDSEHVDHIDNDKLNDVVSNLQIVTPRENNLKKNKNLGIKLEGPISLICPVCEVKFSRPARNIKNKLKLGKKPCCSRKCGGVYSHKKYKMVN